MPDRLRSLSNAFGQSPWSTTSSVNIFAMGIAPSVSHVGIFL